MITVLAENKENRAVRATIDLPASDGQIKSFYKDIGVASDDEISIRYAGTKTLWATDSLLLYSCFENCVRLEELNSLSYVLERMNDEQQAEYDREMHDYLYDLGSDGFKNVIKEAYDVIDRTDESPICYDGDCITEMIKAERLLQKPYPEMNKDVFWQMIEDAKADSDGDYKQMEDSMIDRLSRMSPQEIILYKDINDQYVQLANREGVYEAGSELQYPGERLGLSDDGFTDFRCWLIGQGKEVYMNAMKEPDSVLSAGLSPYGDWYSWESFNYIASYAYTKNTGEDLYDQERTITQEQKDEIEAEIEYGELNQTAQGSELNEIMKGMEM